LNIPRKEAKEIIDNYFAKFAGIRTYMAEVVDKARELGYVETIMGRRRLLRNINSANAVVRSQLERLAINAPIQGSAADIIKIAMINIQAEMKKRELKSQLLLQVHDELVFDAHRSEVDELKELVETRMSGAIQLKVPLLVETGLGENWLEAH
jgi:DNA polymerase-1